MCTRSTAKADSCTAIRECMQPPKQTSQQDTFCSDFKDCLPKLLKYLNCELAKCPQPCVEATPCCPDPCKPTTPSCPQETSCCKPSVVENPCCTNPCQPQKQSCQQDTFCSDFRDCLEKLLKYLNYLYGKK
nr:expressed protein [Hymenolepis microstoma]